MRSLGRRDTLFRAVELGHIVAGPTAGLILAEMGFEVIKVEKPGSGDIARHLKAASAGAFPYYNRGKKSVEINLKSDLGRQALVKLIRSADVLIDNFSTSFMKHLGLDYDELKKINPALIYVSIRGYGSGRNKDRKSLDYPIEIDSGIAYMNGLNNRPMRLGASLVDMFSACTAVIGIYDALIRREKTHKGDEIESSLFDNAMFMMGQHVTTYQINGRPLKPINEEGFAWGIYDFFRTKDNRDIFLAVTTDDQWIKFCSVFKINSEMEEKFKTNEERFFGRNSLIPHIATIIEKYESNDLELVLNNSKIVFSFLRKPWDLLDDPDCVMQMKTADFNGTELKLPRIPVARNSKESIPSLGSSNWSILGSLGYTKEDIEMITKP